MQAASGLGRAGLWEAKSGKEHGKLVFAPGTAQLQAPFHPCNPQRLPGPDPTDRLVVPGKGSSALTPCPPPAGVRTEQDLYVRLIDSVTKQVSPAVHSFLPRGVGGFPTCPRISPTLHEMLCQTLHAPLHQLTPCLL